MNDDRGEVPIEVEFVRATRGGAADGRAHAGQARRGQARQGQARQLQEWRSLATGRIFEVRTEDSFGGPGELPAGTAGYLVFVDGVPLVRCTPTEGSVRPATSTTTGHAADAAANASANASASVSARRPGRAMTRAPARPATRQRHAPHADLGGRPAPSRSWLWFLALMAVLLVVVLAALL